ncbi:hypothetical protein [Rouxiella sp. Mn2063]|uniref:hypothetical protein n=1 Tax=Rouxiella sp. Mn2063 TaxID=3395262 RepID=UPI003BC74C0F
MECLKKYVYVLFILLFQSVAVSASPYIFPDNEDKDALSSPKVKPNLSWGSSESQTEQATYCLTPSDPGCSNMWHKERTQEDNAQAQRYWEKKFRHPR